MGPGFCSSCEQKVAGLSPTVHRVATSLSGICARPLTPRNMLQGGAVARRAVLREAMCTPWFLFLFSLRLYDILFDPLCPSTILYFLPGTSCERFQDLWDTILHIWIWKMEEGDGDIGEDLGDNTVIWRGKKKLLVKMTSGEQRRFSRN